MLEPTLKKDEEVFLDIKDSARRRVICGLRWDPLVEGRQEVGTRDRAGLGASTQEHDLDLLCLTFDKSGNFIEAVTGEEEHRSGDTGNIYHTGDVVDGEDELDDEQLSMELFNLSTEIHQIFFIAEVQSAHTFGQVDGTEIRLARAIEEVNFAHSYLGVSAGRDKSAFIFGCIYRVSQGWNFKYIGEYYDGTEVTDWAETLRPYLIVARGADGRPIKQDPMPQKGETQRLKVSQTAAERVVIGLNWDPLAENPAKMEELRAQGKDTSGFDLDLACVIFNADGEPVDGVSSAPDENMDESGKIYHSGDDTSGEGSKTDDEAISVELKDLPDYIHHIVFIAEIQSAHTFQDIVRPHMRIADGKTNENQLKTSMASGGDNTGYVFARLSRRGEFTWNLTNIDEYFVGAEIEDLVKHLQRYLG